MTIETAARHAYVVSWPSGDDYATECLMGFAASPEAAIDWVQREAPFVDPETPESAITAEPAPLLDPWGGSDTLPLFLQLQYLWLPCDVCGSWVRCTNDEYQPGYFDGGLYCSERCHSRTTGEEWAEAPDWIYRLTSP